MALQQPVKIQTANLTFAMGHIKKFVAYLDTKTNFEADWDEFNITDEWAKVFEESRGRGRMNMYEHQYLHFRSIYQTEFQISIISITRRL